jgi:hypothetical protein
MMYHHDDRDYDFAASQAAGKMREKLHLEIKEARNYNTRQLEEIAREVLQDRVVVAPKMEFAASRGGQLMVHLPTIEQNSSVTRYVEESLHNWALGQVTEHAQVPRAYVNQLLGRFVQEKEDYWGAKLAADNLNAMFQHLPSTDRRLTRSFEHVMRGFLSTKYKRRDARLLLDGFASACKQNNLIPYRADKSDTRHTVRACLDGIVEPIKDECLGIGVVYAESPVGNGATSLSIVVKRMWCTNEAVLETSLRAMHVGGRLSDDFAWSDETYVADTKATISQINDMMRAYVSPEAIARLCDTVKLAHETKIDPKGFEVFLKKHLSAGDVDQVAEKYRSADVEMLPPGNSVWRASNAISWFANTCDDIEKRYDLQKLAGAMLEPMSKAVAGRTAKA